MNTEHCYVLIHYTLSTISHWGRWWVIIAISRFSFQGRVSWTTVIEVRGDMSNNPACNTSTGTSATSTKTSRSSCPNLLGMPVGRWTICTTHCMANSPSWCNIRGAERACSPSVWRCWRCRGCCSVPIRFWTHMVVVPIKLRAPRSTLT